MKRLEYKKQVYGQKLSAALIAAFPALADVQGLVEWTDTEAWINVPDDVEPKGVAAIVEAHDPTPPEPPKTKRDLAREKLAAIDGTKISGDAKKLLAVIADLVDDD